MRAATEEGAGRADGETIALADEAATARLGLALAASLPARAVVTLSGELGSGKSVLARALLRAFGHAGPVPSPTYALVESYALVHRRVAHLDLYRLSSPLELLDIGFEDIVAAHDTLLVEWPERAASLLPPADLAVRIEHAGGTRRRVRLERRRPGLDKRPHAPML